MCRHAMLMVCGNMWPVCSRWWRGGWQRNESATLLQLRRLCFCCVLQWTVDTHTSPLRCTGDHTSLPSIQRPHRAASCSVDGSPTLTPVLHAPASQCQCAPLQLSLSTHPTTPLPALPQGARWDEHWLLQSPPHPTPVSSTAPALQHAFAGDCSLPGSRADLSPPCTSASSTGEEPETSREESCTAAARLTSPPLPPSFHHLP